jgi:TolB protein
MSLSLFTSAASAAFPGANGRIAFASDRDGGSYKIFTSAGDGTEVLQLTPTGSGINIGPHFSPDGTKIVFTKSSGGMQVYVMNANGTGATNVSQSATNDQGGSWSPDGTKIVFSRADSNFNAGLVVMNADGTGQTPLTTKPSSGSGLGDFRPAWSPDGNTIAFTRYASRTPSQIYTISPAGGTATNVTNSSSLEEDASWSPDSQQLVFDRKIPADSFGNRDVLRMPAAGSATPTPVVTNGADDASPAFSPDGTKIIFSSNRDPSGNNDLYTVNADGSSVTPTLITTATPTTTDSQPDWGVGNDTTPPIVTITSPVSGTHYAQGAALNANFVCADETGGSGISSCDSVVANGGSIDTSIGSPDQRFFIVTAHDNAGHSTSANVGYYVDSPPAPPPSTSKYHVASLTEDLPVRECSGTIFEVVKCIGANEAIRAQHTAAAIGSSTDPDLNLGINTYFHDGAGQIAGWLDSKGQVIASGSGSVIASGSGNVIASGSGSVIAAGSGNVIAAGGGNLSLPSGASWVLVSGGRVIATGSGSVIASGSGNFAVAAAKNVTGAGSGSVVRVFTARVLASSSGSLETINPAGQLSSTSSTFLAPGAGKLSEKLSVAGTTLASAHATFRGRALYRVTLKFSAQGRKLLAKLARSNQARLRRHQRPRSLRVTLTDRFTPKRGKRAKIKRTFSVTPGLKTPPQPPRPG